MARQRFRDDDRSDRSVGPAGAAADEVGDGPGGVTAEVAGAGGIVAAVVALEGEIAGAVDETAAAGDATEDGTALVVAEPEAEDEIAGGPADEAVATLDARFGDSRLGVASSGVARCVVRFQGGGLPGSGTGGHEAA
ncbi:MAG: hypothetical protein PHI71_18035, partial [Acidiphilium sp.]|nr:hypothetical protein [Acidiphilium sp.]